MTMTSNVTTWHKSVSVPFLQLAANARRLGVLLALLGCVALVHAQKPAIFVQRQVPDLTGDTLTQADAALERAGLIRGDVQGLQGETAHVSGQTVAAGTRVPPRTTVGLTLAQPQKVVPELVTVPSLTRMTHPRALAVLTAADLRGGNTSGPEQGIVSSQQPAAGSQVARQTAVSLILRPRIVPEPATVPNLDGRTEPEAEQALERVGLSVGSIAGPSGGKVTNQSPEAGDSVPRGTQVHLSLAANTVLMPWMVIAALIPLLAVGVWIILRLIHPVPPHPVPPLPAPVFALMAHRGSAVYSSPRPQPPAIRFAFSVRDRMPPRTFTTLTPPIVRRQGERP